MKKFILLIQMIALTMLFSPLSYADDDDWDDDDYVQPQINYYYPAPSVYDYYPQQTAPC
jgi:hypothetical protein